MIGKVQIRKWINELLNEFLKSFGFKISPIVGAYGIVKREDNIIKYHFLSQHTGGEIAFSYPSIRFNEVEKIMFEITKLGVYEAENETISINTEEIKGVFDLVQDTITQEEQIVSLCENFKRYFVDLYLPAFEKYSKPENVLQLWDSLDTLEKKTSYFPGPDKYIKILIFSKMCNEPQFEDRCRESISRYETILNSEETQNNEMLKTGYTEDLENCKKVIEYLRVNEV